MKISTLFLWIFLLSTQAFAEKNNGQIEQLKPGNYQLSYPEQTINVFFNYLPNNGLEHFFVEPDLPEIEKYEIVNILKNQIDQLPQRFINDYLDISLFPLNIQNRNEFGYTFDKQIVIDVSKIKAGMSYVNSVKLSLIHEFGHLIEENTDFSLAAMDIKDYLNAMHRTYVSPNESTDGNIFQHGYVSNYASGGQTNQYNASEEFAELFAYLICDETRAPLLEFIKTHPEYILSHKTNRFIEFLDTNIPSLGTKYMFDINEIEEKTSGSFDPIEGELLLAAHELRSYESFNFSAVDDTREYDEQFLANRNDEQDITNEPFNDWENLDEEPEISVYDYNNYSESFVQRDQGQYPTNKKKKKNKKRNGTGLLITGAALYVLLQLLK